MQRTKKITAFVLAIALCVGMLPTLGVNAKAADTGKHMDVASYLRILPPYDTGD